MEYSEFNAIDISEFKTGAFKENHNRVKNMNKLPPKHTTHSELLDLINKRKLIANKGDILDQFNADEYGQNTYDQGVLDHHNDNRSTDINHKKERYLNNDRKNNE